MKSSHSTIQINSAISLAADESFGSYPGAVRIGGSSRLSFPAAIGLAALLAVALPAWAADPLVGTWKLNVAKSTFSKAMQDLPPKEVTEVIREIQDGRLELSQRGTQQGGVTIVFRITYPAQGGIVTVVEDSYAEEAKGMTYIETHVGPGNWYVTTLRDGKQLLLRHKVVSTDGKTKRETVQGMDERGQRFEQIEVYERIAP